MIQVEALSARLADTLAAFDSAQHEVSQVEALVVDEVGVAFLALAQNCHDVIARSRPAASWFSTCSEFAPVACALPCQQYAPHAELACRCGRGWAGCRASWRTRLGRWVGGWVGGWVVASFEGFAGNAPGGRGQGQGKVGMLPHWTSPLDTTCAQQSTSATPHSPAGAEPRPPSAGCAPGPLARGLVPRPLHPACWAGQRQHSTKRHRGQQRGGASDAAV